MKHIKLCLVVLLLTIPLAQALDQNNSSFQFNFNSYMIPHPEKAHRGGEDAYFNSSHLLIVADGVGGWNNQGVDPSKYARFLCSSAEDYLKEDFIKYTSSPLSLIKRAQKENDHVGSSTMVVGSLFNNELRYCYIGDSGFMLIRRYEKLISIFEYVEQQHRFNFPFQLSQKAYGGDDPDTSICGSIQVKNGDILVFGSDGLFDNMEFSEILREVRRADADDTLLTTLAKNLAETSISRGSDPVFNSPFAKRAKLENLVFEGGKLDDTTVIVAQIVNNWRQNLNIDL